MALKFLVVADEVYGRVADLSQLIGECARLGIIGTLGQVRHANAVLNDGLHLCHDTKRTAAFETKGARERDSWNARTLNARRTLTGTQTDASETERKKGRESEG